jgi:hypothetical protein
MANESVAVMNRLEYFKGRLEATITPVEVLKLLKTILKASALWMFAMDPQKYSETVSRMPCKSRRT